VSSAWGYGHPRHIKIPPTDVVGLPDIVVAISATSHQTCAVTTGGEVWCWGETLAPKLDVSGLSGAVAMSTGTAESEGHTCAITMEGRVKCWGDAGYASFVLIKLRAENPEDPAEVSGLTRGAAAVSVGRMHACVLTTEGWVKCWGSNGMGQLGDGTTKNYPGPRDVVGLGAQWPRYLQGRFIHVL